MLMDIIAACTKKAFTDKAEIVRDLVTYTTFERRGSARRGR